MNKIYYALIISCLVFFSCSSDSDTPVLDADATIYQFAILNTEGSINNENNTISLTLPSGTNVTNLKPDIRVAEFARVTPNSGDSVNFMNQVTYTVTAQNGNTKKYVVTVDIKKSSEARLTRFGLKGFETYQYFIDEHDVHIVSLPWYTDLTTLRPMFTYVGAKISQANDIPTDFTKPIEVTVTAEDGTEVKYNVRVPRKTYNPQIYSVDGPLETYKTAVIKGDFYYEGDDFSMNKIYLQSDIYPVEIKRISRDEAEIVVPFVPSNNYAIVVNVMVGDKLLRNRTLQSYPVNNPYFPVIASVNGQEETAILPLNYEGVLVLKGTNFDMGKEYNKYARVLIYKIDDAGNRKDIIQTIPVQEANLTDKQVTVSTEKITVPGNYEIKYSVINFSTAIKIVVK